MPSTQAKSLFSIPEVAEFGYKTSQNQLSFNEELALQERPPPGLEKSFKAFQMQKGIFLEKVSSSLAEGKQTKSAKFEIKTPSTNETTMFTPPLMEALSANLTQITAKTPSMMWEENSRVLYVKGLGSKLISVKHVYNLFSNFGDIKRIILLRAKEVALVEFETLEYAKLAKESLNNLCFFNEYLKISFSNYKEIIPKNISKNTSKEDLMICEKGLSRFKNEKNLNINPPSQILHLSNLEKNSCKEEAIFLFFKDVCEVETMK